MITVNHTTAYYLGDMLKQQEEIQEESNTVILRDFQTLDLAKWEFIKLIETFDNVIIFVTVANISKQKIIQAHQLDVIVKLMKCEIEFHNFHGFFNSGFNEKDIYYQNQIELFDKVKFFEDNYEIFEELACNYERLITDVVLGNRLPYTSEHVFSKNRQYKLAFTRKLIAYMLHVHGGKDKFIGKCLDADRTTIISNINSVKSYIKQYFNIRENRLLNQLLSNMDNILKVHKEAILCK